MNYQSVITGDSVEKFLAEGRLLISLPSEAHQTLAETFEAAYAFFQAPMDEKNSNRLPEDIGYRPMGIEYSQSPTRPDPIESFSADARSWGAHQRLPSASARELYKKMLLTI